MGAISRTFRIPTAADSKAASSPMQTVIASSQNQDTATEIHIHEPALTEDNLGLKTWASSYVLARKWHELRDTILFSPQKQDSESPPDLLLELGAGTGLVGIAAAAVLGVDVLLTDLPGIVTNLARNADVNADNISFRGGSIAVAVLDWSKPEDVRFVDGIDDSEPARPVKAASRTWKHNLEAGGSASLVVAADPIYSTEHPRLLSHAIERHLARAKAARAIVEMPIREAYAEERSSFLQCMRDIGLELLSESNDIGYDDWSEGNGDELAEVECWMTIWAWKTIHI